MPAAPSLPPRALQLACLLMLWTAACSPAAQTSPPADNPAPQQTAYVADTPGTGRGIELDVTDDNGTLAAVVRGRNLGPIFGLAYHLLYDASHLELTTADLSTAQSSALNPAQAQDAIMLARATTADISLGGTRVRPALGDVDVADQTVLATLTFRAVATGQSRMEIARVLVRNAQAEFLETWRGGGTLTVPVLAEVTP